MEIDLKRICVHVASESDALRYRALMAQHHYLGDLAKIGHTLWYIATYQQEWVALLSFSASALKCAARDKWIGWDFRHQYGRLKLIANNSRFLILPDWHHPNLGTRVLALCQRRICADWVAHFNQPLLLLETFVDAARYRGTVYRAGNWICVGQTLGHRRTRAGYSLREGTPKLVFVRALKHVLALAAGAILCGMEGYKAIAGWANDLGIKARERFGCRIDNRVRIVPSESTIRDILIRVDPVALDRALARWNADYGQQDQSLAIDGKTMRNAIDEEGRQTHVMGVVGHDSAQCYTQKKSAPCP